MKFDLTFSWKYRACPPGIALFYIPSKVFAWHSKEISYSMTDCYSRDATTPSGRYNSLRLFYEIRYNK